MLYDIYVGSTGTHRAHSASSTVEAIIAIATKREDVRTLHTYGIWDETYEPTVRYTVELESDSQAYMLAYAIAIETQNDCVLVTRVARESDSGPFMSKRKYRANIVSAMSGNRTLLNPNTKNGYRYEGNPNGGRVAYLVHKSGAEVTPVQ